MVILSKRTDDFGDVEFCKSFSLKLRFVSHNKTFRDEFSIDEILEVLNDKAFDGIGYFEKIEE